MYKVKIYSGRNLFKKLGSSIIGKEKLYRCVLKYILDKEFTHIYIRKSSIIDYRFINFCKKINSFGIKILLEIPTYPYDLEFTSKMEKVIDEKNRKNLVKYIDRIVTYSNDDYVFNIKTIKTKNGIIFEDYETVKESPEKNKNAINLIAVAGFSFWHGYDRLLRGIGDYYNDDEKIEKENLIFHLVGCGPALNDYKKIVKMMHIEKQVIFYGKKTGEELNKIYDLSDIGVGTLGAHRANIDILSNLKSREYSAKGLPMIDECKVDFLPENFKYQLKVNNDESNLNVENIIAFYNKIYFNKESRDEIHKKIRNFASKRIEMKETLKPIINYIVQN